MALFQKTLTRASETRSFQVERIPAGWRTTELANNRLAHQPHRTEWHHVERDLARFAREIAALRREGIDLGEEGPLFVAFQTWWTRPMSVSGRIGRA